LVEPIACIPHTLMDLFRETVEAFGRRAVKFQAVGNPNGET
jgi:hypothetical protein